MEDKKKYKKTPFIKALRAFMATGGNVYGKFKTASGLYHFTYINGILETDCKDKEVIKALKERLN